MPNKTTKKGYVEKSITIPPGMTRALKPILRRHGLTFSAFAREALTALMVAYNKIDKEAENGKTQKTNSRNAG